MNGGSTKQFQISEPDLHKLETYLPKLCERVGLANNDPVVQALFGEVKEILSDVRWSYGPPQEVCIIPASGADTK